ncbi:Uncharacterised protein [Candidatus Bartonella washoeensis]|nr:Uncharacterised protein [Bartonella washoeensis]
MGGIHRYDYMQNGVIDKQALHSFIERHGYKPQAIMWHFMILIFASSGLICFLWLAGAVWHLNFDGVHCGHQVVLQKALDLARIRNKPAVV